MCPYPRRTASAQAQIEETLSSPSEKDVPVKRKWDWQKHTNDCRAVRREAHSLKYLTRNAALILTLMTDVGNNRRRSGRINCFLLNDNEWHSVRLWRAEVVRDCAACDFWQCLNKRFPNFLIRPVAHKSLFCCLFLHLPDSLCLGVGCF